MELNNEERQLIDNYTNGNISVFKEDLNKLSKRGLIDFIYNVQEQGILEANEVLSVCYKYLN